MYSVKITSGENSTFKAQSKDYEFIIGTKGEGITPPDTLLASLGSCIGVYIRKYAEGAGLSLGQFSIKVEAEFLKEKPVSFRTINVSIDLNSPGIDEKRKNALLAFIKNCPIHNTLKINPDIDIKIQ